MKPLEIPVKKLTFCDKEHVMLDYEHHPIAQLDSWHGGCTFYEPVFKADGTIKGYKFGCDYNHLDDMDMRYTVEADARRTIDEYVEGIGRQAS